MKAALATLTAFLLGGSAWGWDTQIYGEHYLSAQTETDQVPESSGVVAGRLSADLYWTNNDSGHPARLWVFRLTEADEAAGVARNLGYVNLSGASSSDWEDVATGPGNTIYVFDGGDNPPCGRTSKRIHRFVEPAIDPDGAPVALSVAYESIRFEYPDTADPSQPADSDDERYDAESLAVHPLSGDIYVVTKRNNSNVPVSYVYKLSAAELNWGSDDIHVLEFIADISAAVPSGPTGMDLDAEGRRLVVRNYWAAYEFTLPTSQPFDDIFQTTPLAINLQVPAEPQGEAVCYHLNGGDLITTSEAPSGSDYAVIYRTPWLLANLQVSDVTMTSARVAWRTREASDSRVDYGETTGYGSYVSDPSAVTQHVLDLPGLSSQTRYYFRVTSGALAYPAPAVADTVFFDTAGCPGDCNCDWMISWRDIDFFVAAMNDNVAAWEALFAPGTPSCPFENNDLNGDGTVTWRDIDPFVAKMNTTCP